MCASNVLRVLRSHTVLDEAAPVPRDRTSEFPGEGFSTTPVKSLYSPCSKCSSCSRRHKPTFLEAVRLGENNKKADEVSGDLLLQALMKPHVELIPLDCVWNLGRRLIHSIESNFEREPEEDLQVR